MVLFSELKYDHENPIPRSEEDDVERLYFEAEKSFMAPKGYAKDKAAAELRERAGFVIAAHSAGERFDPFVPYLAMNYFDRCNKITRSEPHCVDFIAVSCLTLAWKLRDLNFTIRQFLAERPDLAGYTTEIIASMEFRIIEELDWRLRPVLATCYVPYFAAKLETAHGISQETIREIIIYAQFDIWFTKFRPSVIAASALLAACDFLYPKQIVHFFIELISVPILEKHTAAIEKCMEGIILRCHDLKLMIESGVSENESQPKLHIRAGAALRLANAEDAGSIWDKGKEKTGETGEIEESEEEEESKDEQFSLRRTRQRARDEKIAAINDGKGKGVKIAETEESEEKITAVNEDKGKGVMMVESEESEEESEDEQFSLRRNRQRTRDEKIAPISKENANNAQETQEPMIDEENTNNEQQTQEAMIDEEKPNNEQQTQDAIIDEVTNENNELQTQDAVINKGKAALPDQPFGGFSEQETGSDSSIGSEKLDTSINTGFRGLRLTKESLERVQFLLMEHSGTESETEKDPDEVEPHAGKLKQSTRVDVIEEEPIPELEAASEEGSGTYRFKLSGISISPLNISEAEAEAEAAAEEGSGSDLFTLDGISITPFIIPPIKCSSNNIPEAGEGGQVELQRVQPRQNTQDARVSGERVPLISCFDGNDSEEDAEAEAAADGGSRTSRRRTRSDYCSGCTCSLL